MKRPLTIGILVDDLTSAADGAGQFDLTATARPPLDGEAGVSVVRAPEPREDDPSGVLRRIAERGRCPGHERWRFGDDETLRQAREAQGTRSSGAAGVAMNEHFPLAITMGDASGIGPEIVAKALKNGTERAVIFGSVVVMEDAVGRLGFDLAIRPIANVGEARFQAGSIDVVETTGITAPPPVGRVDAMSGQASFDAVVAAIAAARAGIVAGIVTAPINKEAMARAGIRYPGHTEILADHGGAHRVAMMLVNDEIRTVLVTVHAALRTAIEQADFEAQMSAIRLAHEGGRALGFAAPRVAVAGLNPHAGEGGLFGDEEIRIIAPAVAAARAEGIDASGPWPGDTVYMQARKGRFDVVVAQYHDQGLIPVKYLGLEKGVNITLGLPFVRTSPDHGTAFDIAGQGIADPTSLETALAYARRLVAARTKAREHKRAS